MVRGRRERKVDLSLRFQQRAGSLFSACMCVLIGSRTDISRKDRISRGMHILFRTLFPDRKRRGVLLRFSTFAPVSAAQRIVLGGDLVVSCGQTME